MTSTLAQLELNITDEEFAKFCEFFYRKTGISFDAKKKYFAERRIADCMRKIGCATFREVLLDHTLRSLGPRDAEFS